MVLRPNRDASEPSRTRLRFQHTVGDREMATVNRVDAKRASLTNLPRQEINGNEAFELNDFEEELKRLSAANQELLELPVDILGPYAELLPGSAAHNTDVDLWMKHFLRSRANSIEGGTSEILRNIIGERVLGLPR